MNNELYENNEGIGKKYDIELEIKRIKEMTDGKIDLKHKSNCTYTDKERINSAMSTIKSNKKHLSEIMSVLHKNRVDKNDKIMKIIDEIIND